MTDQRIFAYARAKGFRKQTLDRWLNLSDPDRQAVLELAEELKIGENQFRDFLDWLEEISLREGVGFGAILKADSLAVISSDARLGRNDKVKQMKEELRRLRFPRLARVEDEIRKRIDEMGLSPRIELSFPPGLEGGEVAVRLKAASHETLQKLVRELQEALEKRAMREIFILLGGGDARF